MQKEEQSIKGYEYTKVQLNSIVINKINHEYFIFIKQADAVVYGM